MSCLSIYILNSKKCLKNSFILRKFMISHSKHIIIVISNYFLRNIQIRHLLEHKTVFMKIICLMIDQKEKEKKWIYIRHNSKFNYKEINSRRSRFLNLNLQTPT